MRIHFRLWYFQVKIIRFLPKFDQKLCSPGTAGRDGWRKTCSRLLRQLGRETPNGGHSEGTLRWDTVCRPAYSIHQSYQEQHADSSHGSQGPLLLIRWELLLIYRTRAKFILLTHIIQP